MMMVVVIYSILWDRFRLPSRSVSLPNEQATHNHILVIERMYNLLDTRKMVSGSRWRCYMEDTASFVENIGTERDLIGTNLRAGGNIPSMNRSMKFVPIRRSTANLFIISN